jgi:acetoacetate decarboxylase
LILSAGVGLDPADRISLLYSFALLSHALAPVAELPVLEVLSTVHIHTDLTLGLGKVAYDYLR